MTTLSPCITVIPSQTTTRTGCTPRLQVYLACLRLHHLFSTLDLQLRRTLAFAFHAQATQIPEGDPQRNRLFEEAANLYRDAADALPTDEGQRITWLHAQINNLCMARKPLKETLPIAKKLLQSKGDVLEIFGIPPHSVPLKALFDKLAKYEADATRGIRRKKLTMNSVVPLPAHSHTINRPDSVQSLNRL